MKKILSLLLLCAMGTPVWASGPQAEDVFHDAYEYGQCPVCWGDKQLDGPLQCGHKFCKPCIQRAYQSNKNCPYCFKPIETIDGLPPHAPGAQPATPQNHQFRYGNNHILVALQYREAVIEFIRSLTQEEYIALMHAFGWQPGALETAIGGNSIYGDPDFLPLADRRALLFDRFNIPMRAEYRRPWIPLVVRIRLLRNAELSRLQHDRTRNNVRAHNNAVAQQERDQQIREDQARRNRENDGDVDF